MAALEAIGLISGVLGIVSFLQDNIPEQETTKTTVRIAAGLDGKGLTSAGGDGPDIRLWNENGDFVAMTADPGAIDDGGFVDIEVDLDSSTQQTPYMLMSGNTDAVCIAYASMTWQDGSQYAWLGDWGKQCGGTWYYSNVFVNNGGDKPMCAWIDANGDQPQTGYSMHMPSFVSPNSSVPDGLTADSICGDTTVFEIHREEDPRAIAIPNSKRRLMTRRGSSVMMDPAVKHAAGPAKRSNAAKPAIKRRSLQSTQNDAVVISNDLTRHKAAELCTSTTSVGPDFLNVAEGLFCKMSTHTLYPVCTPAASDNCFNTKSNQLIVGGKAARGNYNKVHDWTK